MKKMFVVRVRTKKRAQEKERSEENVERGRGLRMER